jgi:hypothetical protein
MPSNAVKFDRGSPTIVIVNESPDVEVAWLRRAVAAVQTQIDRDFFPLWGWRAELVFEADIPEGAMQLTIKADNPDDDDAQGYHFVNGVPHGEMYTRDNDDRPYTAHDNSWTLSHEILEMIADPGANLYAFGFHTVGKKRKKREPAMVAYEVCDPVQDKHYDIRRIRVSDFVVPEWYEPMRVGGSMAFSFTGAVKAPFAITPGGYLDWVADTTLKMKKGSRVTKGSRRHRFEARARKLTAGA